MALCRTKRWKACHKALNLSSKLDRLRQENQDQAEAFLKTEIGQGFELDKEEIISPSKSGFDGFYMARLSRIKTC